MHLKFDMDLNDGWKTFHLSHEGTSKAFAVPVCYFYFHCRTCRMAAREEHGIWLPETCGKCFPKGWLHGREGETQQVGCSLVSSLPISGYYEDFLPFFPLILFSPKSLIV